MASFMDRLVFQYLDYSNSDRLLFPKKINTGFIYSMNETEEMLKAFGMDKPIEFNEFVMRKVFGASESLLSFDTYQFDDYSKVVATMFDAEAKAKRRAEVFPVDCQKAFDMGVRFATEVI